jgi:hypothetical protein
VHLAISIDFSFIDIPIWEDNRIYVAFNVVHSRLILSRYKDVGCWMNFSFALALPRKWDGQFL